MLILRFLKIVKRCSFHYNKRILKICDYFIFDKKGIMKYAYSLGIMKYAYSLGTRTKASLLSLETAVK